MIEDNNKLPSPKSSQEGNERVSDARSKAQNRYSRTEKFKQALQRYRSKPEVRQKIKKWHQEYAAKKADERRKAREAFEQTEEYKAIAEAEKAIAEAKAKARKQRELEYQREYRNRPGVRERINRGQQARQRKKTELKRTLREESPELYEITFKTGGTKSKQRIDADLLPESEKEKLEKKRAAARAYYQQNKERYKEYYLKKKNQDD